ncbi:uncharacterized protein BT62DRAFT_637053 [Guyanagaster necrorhizus]|uniref:Peptidase A1 domain-containing protein n=1 Tax=Guyanagaster necrorhizus TaxID=856835 RepID=A0A9P7VFW8_9AGAR|nr:uncharacterized protein BT62DRAFT_637053 [Guyanagaster necrorhizus MCA 3950]KAG7440206.1 hypothetical protein BT62DRAFT_637053 [Guyanagaster necrorhizus MCA 3950]
MSSQQQRTLLLYGQKITRVDVPFLMLVDTGSSDQWVISNTCTSGSCVTDVSLYPQTSFSSTGLEAQLFYGDSRTGTYAFGPIGQDTVSLAVLHLGGQYFASINITNTSVLDTGAACIFGLRFPFNRHLLLRPMFLSFLTVSILFHLVRRVLRRAHIAFPASRRTTC